MSSIVNKIKDAVHSDKHHDSHAEGTHGKHDSRLANAADPRIDSDRDGSHTVGGHNNQYQTSDNYTHGTSGVTGGITGSHAEGTHGPHNSRLANAADPRIDSDRDGSKTVGGNAYGTAGTTGATGFGSGPAPNTAGPHNTDMLNKADPRVDSDRDGSKTLGGNTGSGYTGGMTGNTGAGFGTRAEHGVGRVGATVAGTHGTGPAPNTAGPHKNDMLNKADPRVDSDLDGSKTFGTNQTYSQS